MALTPHRLRNWLINKLDMGDCPGLTWISKEEGIFKVPWYHQKDVPEQMKPIAFKVFIEWAKFTNSSHYKEGQTPDYSHSKRNFRCALNKMTDHFEKLQKNTELKDDPHIIYKFRSSFSSQQTLSPSMNSQDCLNATQDIDSFIDDNVIPETVYGLLSECPIQNQRQNNALGMDWLVANDTQDVLHTTRCEFLHGITFQDGLEYNDRLSQVSPAYVSQAISPPLNAKWEDINTEAYPQHHSFIDVDVPNFDDFIVPPNSEAQPMSGVSSLHTPETSLEPGSFCHSACFMSPQNTTAVAQSQHGMSMRVYYGQPAVTMMNETVGENGCRLYFSNLLVRRTQLEEKMFGPRGITDKMLPIVDQCAEGQIKETDKTNICEILKEMDRGFTLTFKDGDIYAQRFCRCRVFFCDANFRSSSLDRRSKVPQKVFDFKNFMSELNDCVKSSGNPSKLPPAHFYLTIGKNVNPGNKDGPMSKVPISICITHLAAEQLYNETLALKRGQLDSMQSLYSDLDSLDRKIQLENGEALDIMS
ncbi:interferon Regulatory Factor [Elysia marginata]|uniref:Interferon Regulatory Factor n=1 Tax=Elysia marginata TaxID=1093978 RepID=A0AAV4HQM8_9GAST|nr:interferon Regulatory Factor [Elysia marginata]